MIETLLIVVECQCVMIHSVKLSSDENILKSVVSFVASATKGAAYISACQDLDRAGKSDEVLLSTLTQSAKLLNEATPAGLPVEIVAALSRGGVECCFMILTERVVKYAGRSDVEEGARTAAVRSFVAMLAPADAAPGLLNAKLRLKVAVNLYNTLPSSALRCEVLRSVVSFASASGQIALVRPYLLTVDAVVSKWGIADEEKRQLYALVASAMKAAGDEGQAHRFHLMLIDSYDGAAAFAALDDAAESSTVLRACIAAAITSSIRAPVEALRAAVDLLSHPALAYFKSFVASSGDNGGQTLVTLLELVMVDGEGGELDKYEAFLGANGARMSDLGLDADACREKIRLLALCSLASQAQEIAYADAAAVLKVTIADVEQWVVDAMTRGLIDARLDQQREVIIVHASTQRTRSVEQFAAANGEGQAQWVALKVRLDAWKSEMGDVLDTLERVELKRRS